MEIIDLCKNCSTTECGHQFHSNCLMKSIAYNGFGCPYCRFEMVEDISEDEDEEDEDDEEYQEGDGDEDQEQNEEGDGGEDDDEESDDGDEEDGFIVNPNEPLPSFELIQKKFIENGITYESLVKTIMFNSMIYHKNENFQEYQKCNTFMEELFFDVVTKYTPEEEKDVALNPDKNELNFYFLQDDYIQKKYQREMETSLERFLALDDDEDENSFLIDTFVNDTFLNNRFMEVI